MRVLICLVLLGLVCTVQAAPDPRPRTERQPPAVEAKPAPVYRCDKRTVFVLDGKRVKSKVFFAASATSEVTEMELASEAGGYRIVRIHARTKPP